MPDDTITLISTTDTPEQVQEALTNKPAEKPAETSGETPAAETPAAETPPADAPPADETPEQREERETKEASEAGRKLGERAAKRKKSIQEEIDELTRSKYAARRDVEAEEARLQELRHQRQQLEPPPEAKREDRRPAAQAKTEGPEGTEGRSEPKLDAVDEQGNAKYATYEDYLSDHAVWTREEAILAARTVLEQEKAADRDRIERESTTRAVNERLAHYNNNLETFKKTHADFDAAFEDAKEAVQDALGGDRPPRLEGHRRVHRL